MAKAPRVGVSARAEGAEQAKRVFVIKLSWRDEPCKIAVGNIPIGHRMAVRSQTGMALSAFTGGTNAIDVDSIAVLVWVYERMHGRPDLSWPQFLRSWPEDIGPGDIDVWAEDPMGRAIDEEGNLLNQEDMPRDPFDEDAADLAGVEELEDPQS